MVRSLARRRWLGPEILSRSPWYGPDDLLLSRFDLQRAGAHCRGPRDYVHVCRTCSGQYRPGNLIGSSHTELLTLPYAMRSHLDLRAGSCHVTVVRARNRRLVCRAVELTSIRQFLKLIECT